MEGIEVIVSILEKIKKAFGRDPILRKDQVQRLTRLPKDQALKELGMILYDDSVKRATKFVNGELNRGESPYQGVPVPAFFHEIVAVTFWLLHHKVRAEYKVLQDELHENYFRSFSQASSREECTIALLKKYDRYNETWNEITGHLDDFALAVVRNIFGTEESLRTRERAFWIIQYADHTAQAYSRIPQLWKKMAVPER